MDYVERRADRFRAFARGSKAHVSDAPIACGKACYRSRSQAKSALRRLCGSGLVRDKHLMGCYFCRACDAWHIGHSWNRACGPREAS